MLRKEKNKSSLSGEGKKTLDICLYGNVISAYGTRSHHIGCVQRGR